MTMSTRDSPAAPPIHDYVRLLLLAAAMALPIAATAWGFLQVVDQLQEAVWETWPKNLGYDTPPWWWVAGTLAVAGVIVGIAVVHLPGKGGHVPALGAHFGAAEPRELFSIIVAGVASIALGAVIGPEGPLLALGGGLGVLGIRLARHDAPESAVKLASLTGTAVAISTIFGSPLIGAVFVLEALGLAGAASSTVLVPGLLGAGIGALIFTGLDSWTGLSSPSLALPALPDYPHLHGSDIAWAVAIGIGAALVGRAIKLIGRTVDSRVGLRPMILTPLAGLAVAACAIAFTQITDHDVQFVLMSGQTEIGPLLAQAGDWSTKALVLVVVLKGLAYGVSLGSFRGGPTFPALFLGAASGLLLADLPGLAESPAVAMGMGAMCAVILGMPLSSVVLVEVMLVNSGSQLTSLVIVAVVVAHVATMALTPAKKPESERDAPLTNQNAAS